jgi:hypothetical protein
MLLFFFAIMLQPIILFTMYKVNLINIHNIGWSKKHTFNKLCIIIFENLFLILFTNYKYPSINHSPIIVVISIIITYMLRRIVRTYSIYQSMVYLYHPEDKRIYWFGSYYVGIFYSIIEELIKFFICVSIIELNYWTCIVYLLLHNIIESSLYYTQTLDSSPEIFHITSNYIFKKLNE